MTDRRLPSTPQPRRRNGWLALAGLVAASTLLASGVTTAASPAASPSDIPITPLAGLTSLDATVSITADGTLNGKPTQGDLTATLTSNDQGESQIDVTGSLLGDVVAQFGGKAVSLFRPRSVSVYSVPEGAYVVVSGLLDICIKPDDSQATQALDQLSPGNLMTILTSSDVARGRFVGDETLGDLAVKHYVVDGETFLAAAQASSDPTVTAFAQTLTGAGDADLYLSADGGYPVSYRGSFSGDFAPLGFSGDFAVQIDLTGVNTNTAVDLPGACDHPISQ